MHARLDCGKIQFADTAQASTRPKSIHPRPRSPRSDTRVGRAWISNSADHLGAAEIVETPVVDPSRAADLLDARIELLCR
jgi:hypothetical protein